MTRIVKGYIPWYPTDQDPNPEAGKCGWISFYNGESIVSMSFKDFDLSIWKKFVKVFKIECWTYMENLLP